MNVLIACGRAEFMRIADAFGDVNSTAWDNQAVLQGVNR